VARQSVLRWHRDHDPVLIGWTPDYTGLRRLHDSEAQRACYGTRAAVPREARRSDIIVPWHCTYVLPELLAEPPRAHRLKAMVEFSGSSAAVIGFDCVPLTSAETTAFGMSGGFALNLAAVAHMDRVATISHGAATEYRGWRAMLRGAGLSGPQIVPIPLPVEGCEPTAAALSEARQLLIAGDQPMVLVVGSHEPRKNHLAVLHAAELLWRDGLRFSLNFVGGNSWNSERFERRLAELQAGHRPVQAISALSDDLLWAAYRLARFTLFPSFNEGFGLPVAESLASGTPVVTSDFGSMREIAVAGGAVLVNPHDDREIAAAMRSLLTDDELLARLTAETRGVDARTWDDYAERVWQYLVHAVAPEVPLTAAAPRPAVAIDGSA
jgi:glycosyltransferase involved in cell wall biosynthesis